jgi:serine protease
MQRARRIVRLRTAAAAVAATAAVLFPNRDLNRTMAAGAQAAPELRLTAARAQAFIDAHDRHLNYLPGEVLVKFKAGVSPVGEQRALMALRSRPDAGNLEWQGGVAVVRDASQPDATVLAAQLAAQPEVEYAEPNFIAPIPRSETTYQVEPTPPGARPAGTPNDPDYTARQWNFADLDVPKAWDIQPGGNPSLIVAVIDTGITVTKTTMTFPVSTGTSIISANVPFDVSPDLTSSKFVKPFDFAFFGSGSPVLDMDSHGTHVASTIVEATNNSLALAGLAYNVQLMPVKVCTGYWEEVFLRASFGITTLPPADSGGCAFSDISAGIRYAADNGAKVINISLGGTGTSQTMQDALVYAVQHGAFIAVSAGNSHDEGNAVEYPAGYAPGIDGMMAVAATGKSRTRAYYSSTGTQVEIAAPGGNSRDGGSSGLIYQVTLNQNDLSPVLLSPRFDRYLETGFQGTSMASPHVAGLAALLISQLGSAATPALIEQMIRQTALDLGQAGKDEEFGYGLIQPRTALFGRGVRK